MSSSSDENMSNGSQGESSEFEDETSMPQMPSSCHIAPYQFEPLDTSETSRSESGTDAATVDTPDGSQIRRGNVEWCTCGNCAPMETENESICCKEQVPGDFFAEECVTLGANFAAVCLHREVLRATLSGLNNLRGDVINFENRSMLYAAYRIFTWWVHNRLGRGVRKVIPSCAIWVIRNTFPEANMIYVPFQEATDEITASIQSVK